MDFRVGGIVDTLLAHSTPKAERMENSIAIKIGFVPR